MLNFARTSKPEKPLCDIHAIIDDVMHFIQQHAKMGDIRFEKTYDRRIEKLLLDEKKIKQVFINLVMNAKHAISEKGSIKVKTARDVCNRRVLIHVIDDGRVLKKNTCLEFSTRSSPPSPQAREQAWDCRSATVLLKTMAVTLT